MYQALVHQHWWIDWTNCFCCTLRVEPIFWGSKDVFFFLIFLVSHCLQHKYTLRKWAKDSICRNNTSNNVLHFILVKHYDVMKCEIFRVTGPLCGEFTGHQYRSPVNPPHKGQWRRALMFSVICSWIKAWVNNREAGDLRRHRAHYDVIVMNDL